MEKRKLNIEENIFGWIGAILIVVAYFLLSSGYFNSKDFYFNLMQFLGAGSLAINLFIKKDYSVLALQIAFCIIALYAIFINL